ncbi:hypothetical protein [Mycobacterium sp. RTGN5]|uniref:hypothetical protein n=1 Tax=Mycobacterium sp. RTGN5 TaxID=3016522 RepID=UPI0029C9179F|nr:hypothetical protein [Mycobacterium sp. RTGN5]
MAATDGADRLPAVTFFACEVAGAPTDCRAWAELDVEGEEAGDEAGELSAAATAHPVVIETPNPSAINAPNPNRREVRDHRIWTPRPNTANFERY